jgi:Zn-dependent protease
MDLGPLFVFRIPNLLIALTIHEFCHAFVAYKCGDNTAKYMGRLTLNPLSHLDLIGTICLLFAPIGWAKPVPVDPANFRHPRRDDILVSLAGPVSNLIVALIFGMIFRLLATTSVHEIVFKFLLTGITMNIGLALFNLIPVSPLDGSHVLKNLLSYHAQEKYMEINRYAPFIVLAIVLVAPQVLWVVLGPPLKFLVWLFTGINMYMW